MFNAASLNAVNNAKFSQKFVRPLYDSYCFSNIPQTIEFLLTGTGHSALPLDVFGNLPTQYEQVILFFVDAFGWIFFSKYAEKYAFLKTVLADGVASKLTSQFPSTTAAHVTSINTGLNVGQSGVYEWHYYEPLVDELISPLFFSYAGEKTPAGDFARDSLKRTQIPPAAFFPKQGLYTTLHAKGVVSYVHQFHAYTHSTYSDIVYRGANMIPFNRPQEAFSNLQETVTAAKGSPTYHFLYYDKIDAIGHHYGPNSPQFAEAVDTFLTMLDQLFYAQLHGKVGNTLFIMTADHGQIPVDPRTTFYLNKHAPGVENFLQTNRKGKLLVPAGSARDMFLHVKEERLDEAIAFLQKYLAGKAEVYPTKVLLEQHFFGSGEPSPEFLGRVGNVVILPYQDETVWWYEKGIFEMRFLGHHGGLTPEEMEIPLLVLPL